MIEEKLRNCIKCMFLFFFEKVYIFFRGVRYDVGDLWVMV